MKVVNSDGGYSDPLTDIVKMGQQKMKEIEQKKERLLQEIIYKWKQIESVVFWRQCFQAVPFETIRATYHNIESLMKSDYPVNNPAAFFVHTLKKMGYYPWKKEDKEGEKKKA